MIKGFVTFTISILILNLSSWFSDNWAEEIPSPLQMFLLRQEVDLPLTEKTSLPPGKPKDLRKSSPDVFDVIMDVSLSQWQAKGDFTMYGGPPTANNTWELTHPVDSNLLMASLKVVSKDPVSSPVWFDLSVGWGPVAKDTIRDTDWDASGDISDLSYSDSDGTTTHFSFCFGYPLIQVEPINTEKTEPEGWTSRLDLLLGNLYLKNSVDYKNSHTVIENYLPVDKTSTEKWCEYDLVCQGFEIGLQGNLDGGWVNLEAQLGYVPYLNVYYRGLRYPEKPPAQQSKERILADGYAVIAEFKARFNVAEQLNINLGYKYLDCTSEGEDQPGTAWSGSWEELDVDFKGFFFGAELRF